MTKEATMRHKSISIILACLLVAGIAATVSAVDTSPYLVSNWYIDAYENDEYMAFFIANPTPIPLVVYAAFYTTTGAFSTCVYNVLQGNDTWSFATGDIAAISPENGWYEGTVKFFAFPQTTSKFDPNAVIGGFKQYVDCDMTEYNESGVWYANVSEANMKAVTLNSSTIGEFQAILGKNCSPLGSTYIAPQDYCSQLPLPNPA